MGKTNKFIDKNGNETAIEVDDSCVILGDQSYVKVSAGFLYDPYNIYADKNDLIKIDPFKAKKIFDWMSVNKEIAELYAHFLTEKSRASFVKAQSMLDNSPFISGTNKFKRSKK